MFGEDLGWGNQEETKPKHLWPAGGHRVKDNERVIHTEWLWASQSDRGTPADSWNFMVHESKSAVSVWQRTKSQLREDLTEEATALASLEFFSYCLFDFPWGNFGQCQTWQRRRTCPTAKPSRRPALPLLVSLSSQSEEFLSWATSPKTGTPSGLSALTPRMSLSPPTQKQVGTQTAAARCCFVYRQSVTAVSNQLWSGLFLML